MEGGSWIFQILSHTRPHDLLKIPLLTFPPPQIISTYAQYKGVELDDAQLRADVQAILDMEYTIATTINTPEAQRRQYARYVCTR